QAAYQAEADSWAEGGSNRVLIHTAGGAFLAGLGGGNALAGAAGAGLSSAFAGKLNSLADAVGDGTGSMLAGNVLSNVLAGAGGALIGGTSGAFTATNADLYNRSQSNATGMGGNASEFLGRLWDAVVETATHPVDSVNYAFSGVLPRPTGQRNDTNADPLVDVSNNNRTPPTAHAVVTPTVIPCAPGVLCPTVAATSVVSPGASLLSSGGDNRNASNSDTQPTITGMDRPLRNPNADFPPDKNVVDAMKNPTLQNMVRDTHCGDCSDIASYLYNSSKGNGQILEVAPSVRGTLNVYENGSISGNQFYHQVYTDGKYVYDPRVSSTPIPKGDWLQMINNHNPGGISISVVRGGK
ncbi:hypothetical protein NUV26_35095, partial [Burkholderia pseudomultivorans]|nr:hypothetical protein [Burkholderia pseudomultivorans]